MNIRRMKHFEYSRCFLLWGMIALIFGSRIMKKTVKDLRKNQNLTARELAEKLKIDTTQILQVEDMMLKDVSEPLKSKLLPILRADYLDKIPWL